MPITYVALLRGVNLGAHNKMPMAALRSLVESLGHDDVRTYIQSGNVVFRSAAKRGALAGGLETAIAGEFGVKAAVVLRTERELDKAIAGNPFLAAGADEKTLHVVFLGSAPTKASVNKLDPGRSPPDEFAVGRAEVYLHCPNGFGRSKLSVDWFERILGGPATIRNWRTVTKLAELCKGKT
jgi:uncharacterized protein (DUF1697 family)